MQPPSGRIKRVECSGNRRGQRSCVLKARESVGQKEGGGGGAWRPSGKGFDLQPQGNREPPEGLELGSDVIGFVLLSDSLDAGWRALCILYRTEAPQVSSLAFPFLVTSGCLPVLQSLIHKMGCQPLRVAKKIKRDSKCWRL